MKDNFKNQTLMFTFENQYFGNFGGSWDEILIISKDIKFIYKFCKFSMKFK